MKLHARFFRALLSEEKKDPYVRKYNNHYKRLEQLVLDAGKEIDLEGY